jgi:hypothetical protein
MSSLEEEAINKELFAQMDKRFAAFSIEVKKTKAENERKFKEFKDEVLAVNNRRFDELKSLLTNRVET